MTTMTIDPGYLEQYKDKEWMETYTGCMFSVTMPDLKDINIFDVAHALSYKCRYNGHTRDFFSVSEHCVTLAYLARHHGLPVDVQFQLLMHDAGETYLPDVPRPIKHLFPDLIRIEKVMDGMVRQRFGLSDLVPKIVKEWDSRILRDERRCVMMPSTNVWQIDSLEPLRVQLECWEPRTAETHFLQAYQTIGKEFHKRPVLLAYDRGMFTADGSNDRKDYVVPDYHMIDILGGCASIYDEDPRKEDSFEHGDFSLVRPATMGTPVVRDR